MTLEQHIIQNLSRCVSPSRGEGEQARLYVAYSGGLDSSVLLHVIAHSEFARNVVAVHVNHGLSDHAALWAEHCQCAADAMGIPLIIEDVSVEKAGRGIEHAARAARMQVFESLLQSGDTLLTGHHQNDQAETFLFRLMRGAGLQGLSAISSRRDFGLGQLCRPMLSVPQEVLAAYASAHQLQWVDDESNESTAFDRNYLRHKVMPAFTRRWPKAHSAIADTVLRLQASKHVLDGFLDETLESLDLRQEKLGQSLLIDSLVCLAPDRRNAVIRRWCECKGGYAPEQKQLDELPNLLNAKADANPCIRWGERQFRRYKGRLYLMPVLIDMEHGVHEWNPERVFEYRGMRLVSLNAKDLQKASSGVSPGQGDSLSRPGVLSVQFNTEGLRCKPLGRRHSQSLKKLFQEYNVEPWLRPFVPIIYYQDTMVAVGDYWLCEGSGSLGALRFEWQPGGTE